MHKTTATRVYGFMPLMFHGNFPLYIFLIYKKIIFTIVISKLGRNPFRSMGTQIFEDVDRISQRHFQKFVPKFCTCPRFVVPYMSGYKPIAASISNNSHDVFLHVVKHAHIYLDIYITIY